MNRFLKLAIIGLVASCGGGGSYKAPRNLENACAIVDERRTTASWRELPHHGDGQSHAFVFETRLTDGARIVGEYVPDELPGFRALDVGAPEATPEDQKRIADEYHAIPPTVPARD